VHAHHGLFHNGSSFGRIRVPSETVLKFVFLNSYFKTALKGLVDDAILTYAYTNRYRFHASTWRKINEFPFDFTRRRMSVFIQSSLSISELVYFMFIPPLKSH
jgi:magnesium-transporting ATPase (P-type)